VRAIESYDPAYFAKRHASPLFAMEVDKLTRCLPRGARVVEVGCGAGRLAGRLRDIAVHYIGLDRIVQGDGRPDILADASVLPFRTSCVDAVVSQHVIEHLHRPETLVQEALRILRPGGCFRFTTPNARYRDATLYADPTHRNVRDCASWDRLLRCEGFSQVRVRSYVPYLGHPYLLYTAARLANRLPLAGRKGAFVFAEGCKGE
jgi:SAM-dependent methyltransferase